MVQTGFSVATRTASRKRWRCWGEACRPIRALAVVYTVQASWRPIGTWMPRIHSNTRYGALASPEECAHRLRRTSGFFGLACGTGDFAVTLLLKPSVGAARLAANPPADMPQE